MKLSVHLHAAHECMHGAREEVHAHGPAHIRGMDIACETGGTIEKQLHVHVRTQCSIRHVHQRFCMNSEVFN